MRRLKKRVLALALAVAMGVGMIPAAHAAGGEGNAEQGRRVLSFNNDWRFYPGEWPQAEKAEMDDSAWLYVNTPHSTIHYTPEHYYQEDLGLFWYRRHFTMDEGMRGQKIVLTFEGAMQEATVWLNGEKLGVHQGGYTQFAFDISDRVKFGQEENVLAVRLDTRPNSNFAPGKDNPDFQYFGGLYRDVYVTVSNPVHITDPIEADTVAGGGVFLTAPQVSQESAVVKAKTQVENGSSTADPITLVTEIVDTDGSTVAKQEDTQNVNAKTKHTFEQSLTVKNPRLWSVNTPELYTVRSTLKQGGKVIDTVETSYGIRKVEWKRDGCYINGEKVELVGVNLHSETYMLGNAQSNDAIFAEVKRLREYGFNFIRMSHYPHDPAFYEACDRYGVAVLDCLAGWQYFNNNEAFKNNTYQQMREQIRVNRNHPSMVAWEPSLNESHFNADWAKKMHDLVKEEYPEEGDSKAYTGGWTHWNQFDLGIGTPQANVVGDAAKYPQKPVIVSEYGDWNFGGFDSTSRVTREPKHYDKAEGGDKGMLVQCDNIQSSFGFNRGQKDWYGATAYWDYADYAGFDTKKLTFCGVVDVARIPKHSAYFFQSQRDPSVDLSKYGLDSGPMVYIANTWAKDSPNQVRVFSNCDAVELYYNDQLVEKKTEPDSTMWAPHGNTTNPTGYPTADSGAYVSTEHLEHPPFTFDLKDHTPGQGTLKAVGYIGGKEVESFVRKAPGSASKLELTMEDETSLKLDGSSAKLVWVDVKDENGTVVNTADHTVSFTTKGPGFVIGEKAVQVRGGQWAVWVRSTRGEGPITLTATVKGLTAATVTIPTQKVDGLPQKPEGGDADEQNFEHPIPPVNIFLNKKATASSVNRDGQQTAEKAGYANDGKVDTKWCAANPKPSDPMEKHWWQVDLGSNFHIDQMKLVFEKAGNWKYHIAVSNDPEFQNYTIPQGEIQSTDQKEISTEVDKDGRYVRIYLNCPASDLWPCIREVSGTGTTDNVAMGKPAKASNTKGDSSPALGVDGNIDTFWNSGTASPAWYQVDLGQAYKLSQVALSFTWANPSDTGGIPVRHSFTVQGSMDGTSWYDMGTWSDLDQNDNQANVTASVTLNGSARYIKVSDLWAKKGGTTNQWAEIAELSAKGEALGRPVRLDYAAPTAASSSAQGSHPSHGNDGNPQTFWVPDPKDPNPAWQFDAGGLYDISLVELTWNSEDEHRYAIDISIDGEHWVEKVDRLTKNTYSSGTTRDSLDGTARFVRVRLEPGTTQGFWINSTGFPGKQALKVQSVAALEGVTAPQGTPFDQLPLPGSATVTLDNGSKTSLPITWSQGDFNSNITQPQSITGALKTIPGIELPQEGVAVHITVTLLAAGQHTITFESNGGTVIPPAVVEDGQRVSMPTPPTKDGYQFEGWYTDEGLTQAYDFQTPVTKSLTLYAKWGKVQGEIPPVNPQPPANPDVPGGNEGENPGGNDSQKPGQEKPQQTEPPAQNDSVQTGDNSRVLMLLIVVLGSAMCLGAVVIKMRRGQE